MSLTMMDLTDDVVMQDVGVLLRKWAADPSSRPGTPEGVKKALEDEGVSFAPHVKGVKIHDYEKDIMHVALPQSEQIEATFDSFITQAGRDQYSLSDRYRDIAAKIAGGVKLSQAELDAFYHFRLADYVLQHCE